VARNGRVILHRSRKENATCAASRLGQNTTLDKSRANLYIQAMNLHRHDKDHCCAHGHDQPDVLAGAEAACAAQNIKLTPARRQILELLCNAGKPLGAYDLIEKVGETTGKRPAPISIYRALDFLLENGLVHKLATRNAYLACGHGHLAQDLVVFLICDCCGGVAEATSEAMRAGLGDVTGKAGFKPRTQVLEVAGLCARCVEPA
jgi:Fur family transcriptional regulator, zinc uptake regulator